MIDEEFAAASNELFQIRRRRAECAAIDLSGKLHMLCEIEGAKIPVWILEHYVLEQIVGDAKRLWSGSLAGPEQLASRFQAGRDFLARLWVFQSAVDPFRRLHLRPREATRTVGPLALGHVRVEVATRRIIDETILHAIERVACVEHGLMKDRILARRDHAGWIVEGRLGDRHQLEAHVRPRICGSSGDDAVEILGKALRLLKSLSATVRAAVEVGEPRRVAIKSGDGRLPLHGRLVDGAIAKVDQLVGMAQREARAAADVTGVCGRGGVSASQRGRKRCILDRAGPAAVTDLLELSVPAGERHPNLRLDVGVARRLDRGRDTTECRQIGEGLCCASATAAACRSGGRRELSGGHRLCRGNGGVRQLQRGCQALTCSALGNRCLAVHDRAEQQSARDNTQNSHTYFSFNAPAYPSRMRTGPGRGSPSIPHGSSAAAQSRLVRLGEAVTSVGHCEDAVLLRGDLEVIRLPVVLRCGRGLLALRRRRNWRQRHRLLLLVERVGDKHSGNGELLAAELGEVNLPHIFEIRRGEEDFHRVGLRAFAGAVIGDYHARAKSMREKLRIDVAVTSSNQEIHCAETVVWTHQVELSVQGQIAEMNRSKPSECDEAPKGLVIFGQVDSSLGREVGTIRVWGGFALDRCLDDFCSRSHNAPIDIGNRNFVAGFRYRVLRLAVELPVAALEKRIHIRVGLSVRSMVDELFDGNAGSELGQAPDMITVVVSGDEVVDLREARVPGRGQNAFGITYRGGAAVSGIDEHRLSRRRGEEHGVTALDVHYINIQRRSPALRYSDRRREDQKQ